MSTRTSSPPRRLVDDRLWTRLEPLIPPPSRPRGPGGRPRRDDRLALEGILFVLTTGIGWAAVPAELGFGSGWTCWRRLREWQRAGVWDALHRAVLGELGRVVHRDPELVAELVARRLAALEQVRDATRDRLAETLLAWLVHRGQRQPIAETLHVHPQTVGYRLTQLRKLFGKELDDPSARFELEIALRAVRTQPTWPD